MLPQKFIKGKDTLTRLYMHAPSPIFRRAFDITEDFDTASITIGTTGFYKLYLNGKELTKGFMAPYIANPEHYVYYDSYEVGEHLVKGENVLVVVLGNGFQNPTGALNWFFDKASWVAPLSFAMSLALTKNGESKIHLESDEEFLVDDSPYDYDDIRMGVVYDARRETDGIFLQGFDVSGWKHATVTSKPHGEARLCTADPIKARGEISPVDIKHIDEGYYMIDECRTGGKPIEKSRYRDAYLYDFGTNSAGVVRLKINAQKGQKITLRFGELLVDGNFQQRNLSSVKSEEIFNAYVEYNQRVVYICREGENVFTPDFTYFGFRYVLVEGIREEDATRDLLTYVLLSSDLERKTEFNSSDEIANALFKATLNSDLSNIFYIPTDCPHREKNGWTGDASASAEQFMLNLSAERTLKEWMRGVKKAQNADGVIPGVVPTAGWCYDKLRGPIWDSVSVEIPYYIYKYTMDKEALSDSCDMINAYLTNIKAMRDGRGLVDYGLTDWNQPCRSSAAADAPREVTDTAACIEICKKAEKIFDILGMNARRDNARELRISLTESFRAHLINYGDMTVSGVCQTSQAIAIAFGIFGEDELPEAKRRLREIIKRDGERIASGILGLRYIFHVLCDMGEAELAMKMITRTDKIGYGFWIKEGYDSLWETFADRDGPHVSKNHHYFGDISSIFVQRIAGLLPNPELRDLSEFRFSPELSSGLEFAEASYLSPFGKLSVSWRRYGDKFKLKVDSPSEIHGSILLPCGFSFDGGGREKALSTGEYVAIKE